MYKKSELYKMFMENFFEVQRSAQNVDRITSLGATNTEVINIAQQAATESTAEILLNMLGELGIIENDVEITSSYRTNVILEHTKSISERP